MVGVPSHENSDVSLKDVLENQQTPTENPRFVDHFLGKLWLSYVSVLEVVPSGKLT